MGLFFLCTMAKNVDINWFARKVKKKVDAEQVRVSVKKIYVDLV